MILKSSNGGNNWTELNSNVTAGLYSSNFLNENSGWICGDSGKLLYTSNGGINFTNISSGSERYISDIWFNDANTGWYASGERKIFKTTNGGLNWYVPHAGVFSGGVGAVQFLNANTGIGFTYDNKILLSSNGGSDWTVKDIPPNNYLNNVFAVNEQNYYAVGDFGFIYHSTDAGESWLQEIENNFDARLFGI